MVWKFWQKFLSFYHNSRVWQTDGGTEILLMANTALHSMERGKTMTQVYKNDYKKKTPSNWLQISILPIMKWLDVGQLMKNVSIL